MKIEMMNEIENIIVEDEFIVIITTGGDRRTIRIDNEDSTLREWVHTLLSTVESIINETQPDIMGGISDDDNLWQDDYGDVDEYDW